MNIYTNNTKKMKFKHKQIELPVKDIKPNPNNPRVIKDHRFKLLVKSIQDFPEMLSIREIVVDEDYVILGGNMRYKACLEAGLKNLLVTVVSGLDEEKKKEFIIKDNANYGVWDWDVLANEYDNGQLNDWGLNIWKPDLTENITIAPATDNSGGDDEDFDNGLIDDDEAEEKKIIQIEFNAEDYERAFQIYSKLKEKKIDVPTLFINQLKKELCK